MSLWVIAQMECDLFIYFLDENAISPLTVVYEHRFEHRRFLCTHTQ